MLFIATKIYVRVYNLHAQTLVKTLMSGCKWISSIAVHPSGDNLILGSYDRRLCWFDLDLSTKPYRTLRYHRLAIRNVVFHPTYPLFASASDDASVNVFHGMVYNDLMQNALIVPLKILRGQFRPLTPIQTSNVVTAALLSFIFLDCSVAHSSLIMNFIRSFHA